MPIRQVSCPKCAKPFPAMFEDSRKRKVVNTPCCGWVGKGGAPAWARKAALLGAAKAQSSFDSGAAVRRILRGGK